MTQSHHVSEELLMSYEAGSLAEGWSLAVATHLASCQACRARARQATAVGGALLDAIEMVPMRDDALSATLERIETLVPETPRPLSVPVMGNVPPPLRPYIGPDLDALAWRRMGPKAQQILIPTGDSETSVRLLRIPAGAPVPEHGHRGLELTVVLRGMLIDGDECFDVGDIEEGYDGLEHQPRAGEHEECICLAVTDAPLRFKNPLLRLMQPLLKI